MTEHSKSAKKLAIEFGESDMSWETLCGLFDKAIQRGRTLERAAIKRRIDADYNETDGFDGNDWASWEVLGHFHAAIYPEISQ